MRYLLVFGMSFVFASISGCSFVKSGVAYFQPLDDFHRLNNTHVYYADGAKNQAVLTKNFLEQAVAQVEQKQYLPFKTQVVVYVCATKEQVAKYTGAPDVVKGVAFNEKIFLSPMAFETDIYQAILVHELSHLEFEQYLGNRSYVATIPAWFREGMAVYVSDGGGAEKVSIETATQQILSGQSIKPNDSGSLFLPRTAYWFDLKPQMFYRQSGMFVSYLRQQPVQFKQLVLSLLNGMAFKSAFESAFDASVMSEWNGFVQSLKSARQGV